MGVSLEALWKASSDEEIVQAIERWTTLNDEAKRILRAEVERRGLSISVPALEPSPVGASRSPAGQDSARAFNAKTLLLIATVLVLVVLLARLT